MEPDPHVLTNGTHDIASLMNAHFTTSTPTSPTADASAVAADVADTAAATTPPTLRFCLGTASTVYGQSIVLCFAHDNDTALVDANRAHSMRFEPPAVWTLHHQPSRAPRLLRYKYGLRTEDAVSWESGAFRELNLCGDECQRVLITDVWRARPDVVRDVFSTSAFSDVVFRVARPSLAEHLKRAVRPAAAEATRLRDGAFVVRFVLFVPRVEARDEVCVMGECDQLGASRVADAVALSSWRAPEWSVDVAFPSSVKDVSFRYIIRRGDVILFEDATTRRLSLNERDAEFVAERRAGEDVPLVIAPCEKPFEFERKWKGVGVALPVFSIRSERSFGVGEFADLPSVVDFCRAAGYQLLQLLPVNDTRAHNTYMDCYPYSAVSSFALHPQYLNLEALGEMPKKMRAEYVAKREQLNALATIDYMKMITAKNYFIKALYKLQREHFLKSDEFLEWFDNHQGWLVPYALFRFFMEINGSSNYDEWGARSNVSLQQMKELASPDTFHFEYLALTYYIQFHLHKQLKAAADYAANHQVVFKGDLPIGVNRHCADTWTNPHLFRLHMQVGAPPDYFSVQGQNWAFPTYHWDVMKKDNYAWWRSRLQHMSNYFHAYRIDHILGFFRIWEIPENCRTGMAGRFYPAHGITRQELESLGLWDMERYTRPYVREGFLQEMFQDGWLKIREKFFEPYYDRLQFKEAYNTEQKMVEALALPEDAPEKERKYSEFVIKQMFVLFNNVCLLRDVEDPNIFHPRFMLQKTTSFLELPSGDWKNSLHRLHDDYMHHRQDGLWKKNGLERLPMMKSASRMLVCGEDLGMIPKCVPSVMEETSILSLAVQRMPAGDTEFGIPAEYKYECVATTSSHDTSTFRGWWEEMPADQRMRYWTKVMKQDGRNPPPASCQPDIVEWAIKDHLACPAMWTIFPLQDLLGIDGNLRRKVASEEQINDPSEPEHNWCFRLHLNIEDILRNEQFIRRLKEMNTEAHRGTTY
ncbi:unnamed protein product [Agarophyton chilense]|eukprot:gb/GEZJ01000322.1/.p1 GENE.gb/GEZJ01000322.1/~~gb/GEZJ01000322.1/.p1  ORF type:complete len:983 (+),score=150.59 gb/GEZJ01000322.1/:363-3311(+)